MRGHVVISRSSHITFQSCHVPYKGQNGMLLTTTCYMKQSKASTFVNSSIPLFVQNWLNVIYNLPLHFLEWPNGQRAGSGSSRPRLRALAGSDWGNALWSLLSLCLSSLSVKCSSGHLVSLSDEETSHKWVPTNRILGEPCNGLASHAGTCRGSRNTPSGLMHIP